MTVRPRSVLAILGAASLGACLCLAPPAIASEGEAPRPAETAAPEPYTAQFQRSWFINSDNARTWSNLRSMVGKRAPELRGVAWHGEETSMAALRGRIVVLKFWGVWCGPCLRAVPHTNEIAEGYRERGVSVVGVCDGARRGDEMGPTAERLAFGFPTLLDDGKTTFRSYFGQWYPFYVIVDRAGVIRAAGLNPQAVDRALDELLKEQPPGPGADGTAPQPEPVGGTEVRDPRDVPASWFEGNERRRARLAPLVNEPAPALQLNRWLNTDRPIQEEDTRGRVVLLDFWRTECPNCFDQVPMLNALQEEFGRDNLVIIGVCHRHKSETVEAVARRHGIEFPVGVDTTGSTFRAYMVDATPDYYVIDRQGRLRFADVSNQRVEDVVRVLIDEPITGPIIP